MIEERLLRHICDVKDWEYDAFASRASQTVKLCPSNSPTGVPLTPLLFCFWPTYLYPRVPVYPGAITAFPPLWLIVKNASLREIATLVSPYRLLLSQRCAGIHIRYTYRTEPARRLRTACSTRHNFELAHSRMQILTTDTFPWADSVRPFLPRVPLSFAISWCTRILEWCMRKKKKERKEKQEKDGKKDCFWLRQFVRLHAQLTSKHNSKLTRKERTMLRDQVAARSCVSHSEPFLRVTSFVSSSFFFLADLLAREDPSRDGTRGCAICPRRDARVREGRSWEVKGLTYSTYSNPFRRKQETAVKARRIAARQRKWKEKARSERIFKYCLRETFSSQVLSILKEFLAYRGCPCMLHRRSTCLQQVCAVTQKRLWKCRYSDLRSIRLRKSRGNIKRLLTRRRWFI